MEDWINVEKPDNTDLPIRSASSTRSSDVSVEFYAALERGALDRLKASPSPMFHVNLGVEPVYTTFINHLRTELQQEYACSACKHIANRYGDLAVVNDDGTLVPLFWCVSDLDDNAELKNTFADSVQAIQQRFDDKEVAAEYKVISRKQNVGMESQGGFTHMHLNFPAARVCKEEIAGFTSANSSELASMLQRVLADFKLGTIRKVHKILLKDQLPYADSHKASIKWLLELVEEDKMGKAKKSTARHNLLYRYASSSFIGSLKQMRSGALGTLLEDVKENQPWGSIQSRWSKICNPIQYMRPQAAPTQGNIKAAERLFELLGLTKEDLKRRLLVQDDVPEEVVMWSSEAMKNKKKIRTDNKIFGEVIAKENPNHLPATGELPVSTITFTRFVTQVLTTAKKVECWLDTTGSIGTFVTGLEGTKPLMKWHDDEGKNLASHYFWSMPVSVEQYNLKAQAWNEVRCLIPFPWLWDGAPLTTTLPLVDPDGEQGHLYKYYHKHEGFRYLFVLEDSHEHTLSILPLFPEYLKSDFHAVRSTIEAFTKKQSLIDVEDGMARGGFVGGVEASRSQSDHGLKFRVTDFKGEVDVYSVTLFE